MTGIRWLCECFPVYRRQIIVLGYIGLTVQVIGWFFLFPLTAITLYFFDKWPFEYFMTVRNYPPFSKNLMIIISLGFTAFGIAMICLQMKTLRALKNDLTKLR
jgi:hypothetical protein